MPNPRVLPFLKAVPHTRNVYGQNLLASMNVHRRSSDVRAPTISSCPVSPSHPSDRRAIAPLYRAVRKREARGKRVGKRLTERPILDSAPLSYTSFWYIRASEQSERDDIWTLHWVSAYFNYIRGSLLI
jgi:hypothetical protein